MEILQVLGFCYGIMLSEIKHLFVVLVVCYFIVRVKVERACCFISLLFFCSAVSVVCRRKVRVGLKSDRYTICDSARYGPIAPDCR